MGYTKNAIRGISWMSSLRMSNRAMTFLKIAVLARVLTPSQFGIFGIASLILAFLEILTETGINVILIQSKDKIDKYLDSAWVVSIIRGIIIFLIIIVSAPFVASFFKTPAALNIILLISLSPLIKGFINPAEVTFQKNLQFNYEFWFRTAIFFIDALISIIFALITHSVYALAFGLLAGAILEVFLSFYFIKPTPKFHFDFNYIKEIFHKGKWITASSVFNYFGENGDNIVVGKLLGTSSLGLYQLAYKISYIPISEILDVVNKVVFPLYSKIGGDKARLITAFWKTTGIVSILSFVSGGIIFLYPNIIVTIILGPQWLSAVPVVKILAAYGILRAVFGVSTALFLSLEKQNYVTLMTFVRFTALLIIIFPLVSRFGIIGAGYAALISAVIEFPVIIYLVFRSLKST